MIVHNESRERFVIVDKATIEDDRLSFAARGILAFLLSKPPGWEVYTAYLVKSSPQGWDFITARLKELEGFGYIRRAPKRASDGTWDGTDVHVFERPQPENPVTVELTSDQPVRESTVTGKTGHGLSGHGFSGQREELLQLSTDHTLAPASPSPEEVPVDKLLEAVLFVCGTEPASLTPSGLGAARKAVKELASVGATVDDVRERATCYRQKFPTATLTPLALAKHWAALAPKSGRSPFRNKEDEFRRFGANLAEKSEATFETLLFEKTTDPAMTAAAWAGRRDAQSEAMAS